MQFHKTSVHDWSFSRQRTPRTGSDESLPPGRRFCSFQSSAQLQKPEQKNVPEPEPIPVLRASAHLGVQNLVQDGPILNGTAAQDSFALEPRLLQNAHGCDIVGKGHGEDTRQLVILEGPVRGGQNGTGRQATSPMRLS